MFWGGVAGVHLRAGRADGGGCDERINNLNLSAIMSTNSKFVRNRLNKLIGKAMPPLDSLQTPHPPKRKRTNLKCSKKSALFKDYTYIRLHSQSGKVSQLFSFACFRDDSIFEYSFPRMQEMLHDNDEDSNPHQIQEDVRRGCKALKKEVADCSSSHCEDTIESN